MADKKRILLRGAYNLFNFGDDLVLISWLEFLNSARAPVTGNLELYIAKRFDSISMLKPEGYANLSYRSIPDIAICINEELVKLLLPFKFPTIPEIIVGIKKKPVRYCCITAILFLIISVEILIYKIYRKNILIKKFTSFFKGLDMIHYLGGGYFTAWWKKMLVGELLILLFARAVNPRLKVIGTGLGIGPLDSFSKIIFRNLVKKFDYLSVREDSSQGLAEELAGQLNIPVLGDDTILLLTHFENIRGSLNPNRPRQLALNLKDFAGYDYSLIKDNLLSYFKSPKENCSTHFFCFGKLPGPDDLRLYSIFDSKNGGHIVTHDPYKEGWIEIIKNLASSEKGIGCAYHFGVILTLLGIPVLSIYCGEYYRQKLESGLKFFNKNALVLPMAELAEIDLAGVMQVAKTAAAKDNSSRISFLYEKAVLEYARLYENMLAAD